MRFRTTSRGAVATAVLIPAALLSGATASATESPTATATATVTTESTPAGTAEPTPGATVTPTTFRDPCPNGVHSERVPYSVVQEQPKGIKAGDGWHDYVVTVPNRGSTTMKDVSVTLTKEARDLAPDMPNDYSSYVDLQMRAPEWGSAWPQRSGRKSGEWRDVPFMPDQRTSRVVVMTDLAPLVSVQIQVRFRVAENFPVHHLLDPSDHPYKAIGEVLLGVQTMRPDPAEEGECGTFRASSGLSVYEPGSSIRRQRETGASLDLVLLAGAGGAALAVVVGAVYVLRRRR
ncbi:hypothetical protein ABZ479_03630 [Streptomyces sp. NPDC005722]